MCEMNAGGKLGRCMRGASWGVRVGGKLEEGVTGLIKISTIRRGEHLK